MKMSSSSVICISALLLTAPMLHAQDLSKYRGFSLGASLASVLKRTDQKVADAKAIYDRPALIQELTWWSTPPPGTSSSRPNSVEQIRFSFCNDELYKIAVTYDYSSTEGLTVEDLVKSISAEYGQPTSVAPEAGSVTNEQYAKRERLVASWENSQYSFNLVRSYFTDGFGLVVYSKRLNAEAELAIAEAVKLDKQEGPQREAERQKKETNDLEMARQKNLKTFRP